VLCSGYGGYCGGLVSGSWRLSSFIVYNALFSCVVILTYYQFLN
jgi:hypothetical protein